MTALAGAGEGTKNDSSIAIFTPVAIGLVRVTNDVVGFVYVTRLLGWVLLVT